MSKQISTIQTSEVLELMRNLAPILNQKELFEFMLFSNRVLERYMPEYYNDGLSEEATEMKKDKEWLKGLINEEGTVIDMNSLGRHDGQYWKNENIKINKGRLFYLIDQLDESQKPVIPKFVADWIDVLNLHGNNPLREYRDLENDFEEGWTNEEDAEVYHWINKNPYAFIDSLRYGYEVEKEILWEIPMPDLKTSDGHIQYLTYDPKARTYFGSRQNGRLKQTFNAKDLASVPGQYRRYAELCDFKKIEEATE